MPLWFGEGESGKRWSLVLGGFLAGGTRHVPRAAAAVAAINRLFVHLCANTMACFVSFHGPMLALTRRGNQVRASNLQIQNTFDARNAYLEMQWCHIVLARVNLPSGGYVGDETQG